MITIYLTICLGLMIMVDIITLSVNGKILTIVVFEELTLYTSWIEIVEVFGFYIILFIFAPITVIYIVHRWLKVK